jgi:hypothetical protein
LPLASCAKPSEIEIEQCLQYCSTSGSSEYVEQKVCTAVPDGLQGANHSDGRSYRQYLQHRRPPESAEADDAGNVFRGFFISIKQLFVHGR